MTRLLHLLGVLVFAAAPSLAQTTMIPALEPFVDQKVNMSCSLRGERNSDYRIELKQVSDQFLMNYQDLSNEPIVTMRVEIYRGDEPDPYATFEVEGRRVGENRLAVTAENQFLYFYLSLRGLPEGAGNLQVRNIPGLTERPGELSMDGTYCSMSIQEPSE